MTEGFARTSEVVSISLNPGLFQRMEKMRTKFGLSRSAFIASLLTRFLEDERWRSIYQKGADTARRLSITSEEDIDRILHEE